MSGDAAPRHHGFIAFLIGCKLLIHPLLAWLLAKFIYGLSIPAMQAVALMAALPAGTGSFMLTHYHRRDASVSSEVIIGSTLLSVISLAVTLRLLD